MTMTLQCDESLLQRLPLPLAQLTRRAHNAKTALERHLSAFYLWEASLKLLGCVTVVQYAEGKTHEPALAERLHCLARPSLGHWLEFVRRLVPILADQGLVAFQSIAQLFTRTRDDLPRATGLDAALREALEGNPGARTTVCLAELFERLVAYRNKELGHGAAGLRPGDFYENMGRVLLLAAGEVLGRLDLLAGNRLIYLADLRQTGGRWVSQRYQLTGESNRRLLPLELPIAVDCLPAPERIYLEGASGPGGIPHLSSLHPLLIYDFDENEVLFLNARRGRQRTEYLCYTSGRTLDRPDLGGEQRALLARVLDMAQVDEQQTREWALWKDEGGGMKDEQSAVHPSSSLLPPSEQRRTIGEFELRTVLGRGGMGVVYRAWQPSLGREVALKCLTRAGDARAEARFRREIRALGRVDHPSVVKIFASGSEGDHWFYAMELIEGATLSAISDKLAALTTGASSVDLSTWQETLNEVHQEALKNEDREAREDAENQSSPRLRVSASPRLPSSLAPHPSPLLGEPTTVLLPSARVGSSYVKNIVQLMNQVARGVHALHEEGIIHRDIKPGNIMVSRDGSQAVLMDLGLAQLADSLEGNLSRTREFVGTLRYASPEQVLAVDRLDRRSDVYSLGATLWELLTLQPMFGATRNTPTPELMQRIQYEEPEPLHKHHPKISLDLEAVVATCLEKNPSRRYPSALELARDLERFLDDRPVSARPITRLERWWRSIKRRPLEVAFGIVVSLALGAIGLVVFWMVANRYIEAQREKAFRKARSALNDIMGLVNDDKLLRDPRLQPIREKLLEYYKGFVEENEDDPRIAGELGEMYERMAVITKAIGRKDEALEDFRKAQMIYERLGLTADTKPGNEYRLRLARTRREIGTLLMDNRATQQAEEEFQAAEQILAHLSADQAVSLETREIQAELWHERARRCYRDADFTGAIDLYNRSLEIRRELVDRAAKETVESKKRLQYINDLARGYGWRGDAEVDLEKWTDAEKSYRESENLRKQLVAEDPANPEFKFHLARSHGNTARLCREQFRLTQALESFRKAKDLQLALVRENNAVTDYVEDLAETCLSLAGVLQIQNNQDETEKNLEEAGRGFQTLAATAPPVAQRGLAKTDILCGQLSQNRNPVRAQGFLEKGRASLIRAGQAALQWEDFYYLAVAEALLAELSGEIQTQKPEARQRVLAALQQAQRKGFHNADFARKDQAFSKFLGDQRFEAFLDQLKKPVNRGGNHGP